MDTVTFEPRPVIEQLGPATRDDPTARLLLRVDLDGHATVVAASDLARALLHASAGELEGKTAGELMPSSSRPVLEAAVVEMLSEPAIAQRRSLHVPDAQADRVLVELTVSTAPRAGCDVLLVELSTSGPDEEGNIRVEESLLDEVTGLPRRRLFLDRVSHAMTRTRRSGRAVALLLLELDDSSASSDTFCEAFGEKTSSVFARVVERHVRPSDTLARLGPDEFAILLEDLNDPDEAELAARRIAVLSMSAS